MTPLERHELELAAGAASMLERCPCCNRDVDYRTMKPLHEPIVDAVDDGKALCEMCHDGAILTYIGRVNAKRDQCTEQTACVRSAVGLLGVLPALEVAAIFVGAILIGIAVARWIGGAA